MARDPLTDIERSIGHAFTDRSHLIEALTHSSFVAENEGATSYERLEFLGDAVLELVTTELIFHLMLSESEGSMTKIRASVVDEATLAGVARSWDLPAALRLGVGEERSGGRSRDSILSDAVEAVIAAVYVDAGFEVASRLVRGTWSPVIAERLERRDIVDARSRLQELLAATGRTVTFTYERGGPDHAATFTATARVDDEVIGTGAGTSKKAAAIAAASDALARGT